MSSSHPKLLLDTNVIIDYLEPREPFYQDIRLLMGLGRANECSLWVSASQVTDILYILTGGGKPSSTPTALASLRQLRSFVNVADVGPDEVDKMLETTWADAEDAMLYQVALSIQADWIISRDANGFEDSHIPASDCTGFFKAMEEERGIVYAEMNFLQTNF